ncbi:hypothetical protein C482_15528 [Natrialba chahannaoensis JCM 10990]|uniref:Uncharacterized protein n=1 Tax=Natrialba chahannaoensis JCM 10990 TaxID=1227492 RepID=M0ACU0_9EURY|nr:hypothetical protein [Natrialba chahannaoensis]ELY96550.1 hypothetical protein C482_15528 [Natrialba chahannaoensis JCM 10990]
MIRRLLDRYREFRNPPKGTFQYRHRQIPQKGGLLSRPDYFHRYYYVLRQNARLRNHAMFEGYPAVKVVYLDGGEDS